MKALVILASVLLVLAAMGVAFAADNAVVQASVTVPGTIALTTSDNIVFGSAAPGATANDNLVFSVASNAPYKVTTKANAANFVDGSKDFAVSAMKFGATAYTIAEQDMVTGGTAPGTEHTVAHSLTVPSDAEAGSYTVGVTIKAVQA